MCTDGASVMQGTHKGVVTQLKALVVKLRVSKKNSTLMCDSHGLRIFGNSHAIHGIGGVHCVCHRFALVKQCFCCAKRANIFSKKGKFKKIRTRGS